MSKPLLMNVLFILVLINFNVQSQEKAYIKTGIASFYADKFEGRTTANGEIYYHIKKTAAHRTLPFGSIVKVTNLENKKFVVVRINDRGPFADNRIIDLSKSAAKELGFIEKGLAKVKVELIASTDDLPQKKPQKEIKRNKTEYYKLNIQTVKPKGKGVQIGSFKEDENIFRLSEKLRSKYNTEVYLQIANVNNHKLYRIILANSTNENYLEKLKKTLSKEYPDCFIVKFK